MKILLANPETSRNKYDFAGIIDDEPYDLECLSAFLKAKGVDVRMWDGQIDKNFRMAVTDFEPDYVYFCGRTRQENFIKEYCSFCSSYRFLRYHRTSYLRCNTSFQEAILLRSNRSSNRRNHCFILRHTLLRICRTLRILINPKCNL